MESFPRWRDEYICKKDRIVLTEDQLHIPGIRMFGRHILSNAIHSLTWHVHADAFEFSLPSCGTFSFSTQEKNYSFSGGEVFISFPDEVHGTNQTPITVGELYWFQLDVSDEERFLFLKPEAARDMIAKLKVIPHHVIKAEIIQLLPLLKISFELAEKGGDGSLIASFIQLFLQLIIIFSEQEYSRLSADIQKSADYILKNITGELTLEEVAFVANLSCSQFKQKFKKQLGIAPRHYINQQKIEHAKTLLQTGVSVTDVAMMMHFTTSGYFSTVFKKYTLYTPREYIALQEKELYLNSPQFSLNSADLFVKSI